MLREDSWSRGGKGGGSQHQFAPQSPHLPGSTAPAVVAGRAHGPFRVAQLCVCLEASALPQKPGVREQRSALPVDQHGRPLPTLQASLWVIAPGDKPSQKTHPAHGSTPVPLPFGLARRPDSPCVTGQPFVRTPGIPSPLGWMNLRRYDSSFHPQAFHGSHPPRLKHSCSPSQPSLSLEPKPCTKPAPPGEEPPPTPAPQLSLRAVSALGLPARHSLCCTFSVCVCWGRSPPTPTQDQTHLEKALGTLASLAKGLPQGQRLPKTPLLHPSLPTPPSLLATGPPREGTCVSQGSCLF